MTHPTGPTDAEIARAQALGRLAGSLRLPMICPYAKGARRALRARWALAYAEAHSSRSTLRERVRDWWADGTG